MSQSKPIEETYQLPPDFVPITLQRIFDAAWQAFIVEGKPPAGQESSRGWRCRYLTDDGRKCAIGLVLPDGHPSQKSSQSGSFLLRRWPELFAIYDDDKLLRIGDIQMDLHDAVCSSGQWNPGSLEKNYREVAEEMDLTIPGEST